MQTTPSILAVDFGTSNSLVAAAAPGRVFDPAPIDPEAADPTVLRSALYFSGEGQRAFGNAAVRAFVANGFRGRLMRSIKRHLPSRAFTSTLIGGKQVSLEELIACLLRVMRERASLHFDADLTRAVLGRPARFSNVDEDDALAEKRLRRAAEIAGFDDVTLCPEPLAAAYDFAADLDESRLVLVVDLGGGTSDFTLVRMSARGFEPEDVLSVGGVAIAGDAIDGALVRSAVAPLLGSRALYRAPLGANRLPLDADLIELLCSPAELTWVDRTAVVRRLGDIRAGLVDEADRGKLDKFVTVVEDGVGFDLYEAVETTKRALSDVESARFAFDYPGAELEQPVTRGHLEEATARPVERIFGALDETLQRAGVRHDDVEIACLTGGTSRMPLIEAAVAARLPRASLRRLRSFHSVVYGLARHAEGLVS